MDDPALPPPLEERVHRLELGHSTMQGSIAELRQTVTAVQGEMHNFITWVDATGQRMGEINESIRGIREQQAAHHRENQAAFGNIDAWMVPWREAMRDPNTMREVMKAAVEGVESKKRLRLKVREGGEAWAVRIFWAIAIIGAIKVFGLQVHLPTLGQ